MAAVRMHNGEHWAQVADLVGCGRTGDSCRLHWRRRQQKEGEEFAANNNRMLAAHFRRATGQPPPSQPPVHPPSPPPLASSASASPRQRQRQQAGVSKRPAPVDRSPSPAAKRPTGSAAVAGGRSPKGGKSTAHRPAASASPKERRVASPSAMSRKSRDGDHGDKSKARKSDPAWRTDWNTDDDARLAGTDTHRLVDVVVVVVVVVLVLVLVVVVQM